MDEVIFRSSRKLESLQYQLGVAATEGKQFVYDNSIRAKDQLVQLMHHSKIEQLHENAKKLLEALVDLIKEFKAKVIVYITPYNLYEIIKKIFSRKWSKRDICFGCAGFLLGGIIGYCIGSTSHKKLQPFRYMQAIQCTNYSGIESVSVVEDTEAPTKCGKDEVIVNVKATSVHIIDAKICNGYGRHLRKLLSKHYQYSKHDLPVTLGRDCTGIITDIGQNVTQLEIGDEVWLTSPFWAQGTMAQLVLTPEHFVAKKPKSVGFESGCSLPYAGGIALDILKQANLDETTAIGKRVLIQGGCTPIGCILVQILKLWKVDVTCTCFKRAVPVVKALGANDIIIVQEVDFKHNIADNKGEKNAKIEVDLRVKYKSSLNTKSDINDRDLDKSDLNVKDKSDLNVDGKFDLNSKIRGNSKSDLNIIHQPESKLIKELELRDAFDCIFITRESTCGLEIKDFEKYCKYVNGKPSKAVYSTVPKSSISSDNYGFVVGTIFELYIKIKCSLLGLFGGTLQDFGETHICRGSLDELAMLVEHKKLQTVVDKVFHPPDIELALQHIQSTESIGSTVISFR